MKPDTSVIGADSNGTRLNRLLEVLGLPADSVEFVSSSHVAIRHIAESVQSKPLIIELDGHGQLGSAQRQVESILAGSSGRPVLFFGIRSLMPRNAKPESPIQRDVVFAAEDEWGALSELRARWPVEGGLSGADRIVSSEWTPLITIDGSPWFSRHRSRSNDVFVCSASELPDVRRPLTPIDEDTATRLLPFLPFIFFLRAAFGTRMWHPQAQFANFIVDDPPVWDRYGYFAPDRYLSALEGCSHSTTIAFIPWNWNRSAPRASRLLRARASEMALCVHGCDHTGGEFASLNESELAGKCILALKRIRRLYERTEVPCQPVMVFPQGLFSKAAMRALRRTGFVAAFNSTLLPADAVAGDLCVGDLLTPAHTGFDDFPLFRRRYPNDPTLCAVDLYLGRPLLVVEHHEYFRDDYHACRRFIDSVNRFHHQPKWVSLLEIGKRTCWQRYRNPEHRDVLYFGDLFHLENPTSHRIRYRLLRRLRHPERVREVRVNAERADHTVSDGYVSVDYFLNGRESANIQLVIREYDAPDMFTGTTSYHARVWLRRRLSDLRDNYPVLAHSARWVKRLVLSRTAHDETIGEERTLRERGTPTD